MAETLNGHYVDALKLRHDPFSGDAQFFFTGAERSHVLEQAVHLCHYGQGIVWLEGENGLGKSQLLNAGMEAFSSNLGEGSSAHLIHIDAEMSAEQFATVVLRSLDSPAALEGDVGGAQNPVEQLTDRLTELDPSSKLILLLDDGENIGISLAMVLKHCLSIPDSPLRLIIAVEHWNSDGVATLKDDARGDCYLALRPFDAMECELFVQQALQAAGFQGAAMFSQQAMLAMSRECEGSPGKLLPLCRAQLLEKYRSKPATRMGLSLANMLALVGLLTVLVLGLVYFSDRAKTSLPDNAELEALREAASQQDSAQGRKQGDDDRKGIELEPNERSVADVEPNEKPALDSSGDFSGDKAPAKIAEPDVNGAAVESGPDNLVSTVVGDDAAGSESASGDQSAAPAAVTEPSAAVADSAVAESSPVRQSADEAYILTRNPLHFTVQLMGAREKTRVTELIAQHRGKLELRYFTSELSGRPWYVVIYGDFASRESARQAVNRLPAQLRSLKPWIREFGGIQQLLDSA